MKAALLCSLLFILGCTITGSMVKEPFFDYDIYFCPENDCFDKIKTLIVTSEQIDCAFYSMDEELADVMKNKNARVILDSNSKINASFIKKDSSSKLMHNKFCIINSTTVLTGSLNPTKGAVRDRNNILVITSVYLAKNYEEEFEELWGGIFHEGKKTKNTIISLNNTIIKSYFCPEDDCADKVIKELKESENSIYFLAYSFTYEEMADLLLEKKQLEIKGVFFSKGKYSQYEKLKNNSLNVRLYKGEGLMHDKVFIIDNSTVITGSFNPTKNANQNNDENLLIIKNKDVADLYLKEFEEIYIRSR